MEYKKIKEELKKVVSSVKYFDKKTFDIDKNDLILDNGVGYILVTKNYTRDFTTCYPNVSKKLFSDLKRCGLIFTNEELRKKAIERYGKSVTTFWQFDVDRMQRIGYE